MLLFQVILLLLSLSNVRAGKQEPEISAELDQSMGNVIARIANGLSVTMDDFCVTDL
jgi:hypothetical protein